MPNVNNMVRCCTDVELKTNIDMRKKGRVRYWQCTIFGVVRRFSIFNGKGIFTYHWHIRKGKSSYTDGTDITWFISLGNIKMRFVSEY